MTAQEIYDKTCVMLSKTRRRAMAPGKKATALRDKFNPETRITSPLGMLLREHYHPDLEGMSVVSVIAETTDDIYPEDMLGSGKLGAFASPPLRPGVFRRGWGMFPYADFMEELEDELHDRMDEPLPAEIVRAQCRWFARRWNLKPGAEKCITKDWKG